MGGSEIVIAFFVVLALAVVGVIEIWAKRRDTQRGSSTRLSWGTIGMPIFGVLVGAFLGFLIRPSIPIIGQLPLDSVITRGSGFSGADRVFVPYAETSFNYMLICAIIGGVGAFLLNRKLSTRNKPIGNETQMPPIPAAPLSSSQRSGESAITQNISNLAELRDKGVLTEEEFQEKKRELLSRI